MSGRAGRASVAAVALAAVTLAACAPSLEPLGAPEVWPRPPASVAAAVNGLRADLAAIFTAPGVDHAQWSATFQSLDEGDTLYSLNAHRLQVPASVQKLLVAGAAAERLGWGFQFTTCIYATGPIDADGVLDGHLVVTSDGDPTINPRHPQRWGALDDWAKHLAAKGLRQVAGELVGDDSRFAEPGWGLGWAWDDLSHGYGAPVGALQYHENQVEVMIGPGQGDGDRAIISLSPIGSGLVVDHGVTTVAAGGETRVSLERIPGSNLLSIRGQVAADARPRSEFVGVSNPTQMYVNALREALARNGVFVGGNATDIDDLRTPPDLSKATLLLEDRSPPLAEIIDVMLKWSRNGYAETLLRALARPEPSATSDTGLVALRQTLGYFGIPPGHYLARDGSGLSRYDYLTADAAAWLLTYLYLDPAHAANFRNALPVAGVSGTIEDRLKGTPAAGRVWAKTGSMSQVRSLAGYLVTADNEPVVFAIIVNGARIPGREVDAVMDRALVRLAGFSRTGR